MARRSEAGHRVATENEVVADRVHAYDDVPCIPPRSINRWVHRLNRDKFVDKYAVFALNLCCSLLWPLLPDDRTAYCQHSDNVSSWIADVDITTIMIKRLQSR